MASILDGVDEIIDKSFNLHDCGIGNAPHYVHNTTSKKLSKEPLAKLDSSKMISDIFNKIVSNRQKAGSRIPSSQNWRFAKQTKIAQHNTSPEKRLEKLIITHPSNANWANMVPTSSGLVNENADRARNIDLVYKRQEGAYEFIELKAISRTNNPFYAALEILQNGILYLFARKDKNISDAATEKCLLKASYIYLKVLAPANYYKGSNFAWLEMEICRGLNKFVEDNKFGLHMEFEFEVFPDKFTLDPFPSQVEINEALAQRCRAYK